MAKKQTLSPEQDLAANPQENVWVQANAGTGKTSVLVQRLLRILFRADTDGGILCLTYTNAAAGEMRNRILAALREWAMSSDDALTDLLTGVAFDSRPTASDLAHAREIFFKYIDNPDVLKIKTIHGFCEEILRRFPLEAGIAPGWTLISDANQKVLLRETFDRLVNSAPANERVNDAFMRIIGRVSEYSLDDLLGTLTEQYKNFFQVKNLDNYREYFIETIRYFLELNLPIPPRPSNETLQNVIETLKTIKKPAKYITNIINLTEQYINNTINFEKYKTAYINSQSFRIKEVSYLSQEYERINTIVQRATNQELFDNTIALFDLAAEFANEYTKTKRVRNALDFDDLILYTRRLFSNPDSMGWVLSQLDLSLTHILVDEAQDTSPIQWDILRMIAGDFFAEGDCNTTPHAMFVVGDSKQSIYGFQGADPTAFADSRQSIAEQIKNNMRDIKEVPLAQSFRSTAPVLSTVDAFFNDQYVISISNFSNNNHKCFRRDAPGLVEIYPLAAKQADVNPIDKEEYIRRIGDKIHGLIKDDICTADEIMVLVRNRNPMAAPLITELKRRGIDVAGSDRITLPVFPAIRDLLNLTRFCLNNADDYSLCCVLKSPIFRLNEAQIYELCVARNRLTDEAKKTDRHAPQVPIMSVMPELHPDIYARLLQIQKWANEMGPYSFFSTVLNSDDTRASMIAALGTQIIDPLEEFLTICLAYERTQPGTLHHFLKWFVTGSSEVKRDLDKSNGVRVVTVHGSKGLESKVVFLIDTNSRPDTEEIQFITDNIAPHNIPRHQDVPKPWIWTRGAEKTDCVKVATAATAARANAEHFRLLYVAMTRARDQLYIYGYTKDKNPPTDTWHTCLYNVFSHMADEDGIIRITNDNLPA